MTNEDLIDELRSMGIDRQSHKVVALLPLVHVAWADGTVQGGERKVITSVAEERGMVDGDGARILESWLAEAPTRSYVERGQRVLRELARREGLDVGESLDEATLDEVISLCERVARAAGGLFGVLWTVDEREREAIARIATALRGSA